VSARSAQQTGDGAVTVLVILVLAYGIAHASQPAKPAARPHQAPPAVITTLPGPSSPAPAGLTVTNGAGCSPAGDWRSPRLDRRVRRLLVAAASHHRVRVSCIRTGHSWYVVGTNRVSNHSVWRAVDVDQVDGQAVSPANQAARELARWIGRGGAGVQPSEVGSPWDFGPRPWFTDDGHQDHIHIGFAGPTQAGGGGR
jgi:hypothetical protein